MKTFRNIFLLIQFLSSFSLIKAQDWIAYSDTNSGLPSNWISKIKIDKDNNKWLLNYSVNNLVKFNGTNWTVYNYTNSGLPNTNLFAIAIDKNDNKWIATRLGLVKFDGSNWTIYNSSNSCLPSDFISDCDVDTSNNVWLATDSGIVKFDISSTCTTYKMSQSNSIEGAQVVKVDSRNWIWTLSNPFTGVKDLSAFDGSTWSNFPSTLVGPYFSPSQIYCDSVGNVWGGGGHGIFRCDGTNITIPYDTSYSNYFYAIGLVYSTNNFIAAYNLSPESFNFYNGSSWYYYISTNSPIDHYIYDITSDQCGNIWLAGETGLYEFNPSSITNCILSVAEIDNQILSKSYPNPASNKFFIETNQIKNHFYILTITDELGKVVSYDYSLIKQEGNKSTIQIDTRKFENGIYFYNLKADNIIHGKIIISNN